MNHDEVPNPFPGLRPFEFGDNHLFFGRDQQTTELTTRLRKNRFVAVVGTSGSGKSSLVRAGLMPELLSGTMAGAGSSWETTIMRPGGDPLTNLANAIVDADLYDPEEEDIASQVRATLTRSGLGLVEAMRQSELPQGTNFLLVVDQFEEIFRFRRSDDATDEQAAFFVNLLLEASAQADLPLYVIITMRSDFLGECSQFPRLADTVNEGEFLIPRLNRDQRKEAIVGPIKVAGGEIADRLLLRLLNDIGDDPDQLPILQHALMRTWDLFKERGGDGALDLEHYQATGGMGEALSRHADEVYGELPDAEHKRIAEKLFKSLTEKVDANRGIRRPMQLAELHEICGGEESHLREVLNAFRKTGCTFLMPAGEVKIKIKTVIDISHESLMRAWRSLRNWVDEEAQSAKIYRRLADTATLYHEDKAGLYRDPDLQISLSWREESRPNKTWANRYYPGFESAMAFLDQSQEEAEREEREREEARQREVAQAKALAKARARTATIFKFACVGVTILAITAIFAMIDARKSRDEADRQIINLAKRSIATGEAMDAEDDHLGALVWYADAIRLAEKDPTIQSEYQAVFKTKLDNTVKLRYSLNIGEPIGFARLMPGGTKAVVVTNKGSNWARQDNHVYMVDLPTGDKQAVYSVDGPIIGATMNEQGTSFAFLEQKTRTYHAAELATGKVLSMRQSAFPNTKWPMFTGDGNHLIVGGSMENRGAKITVVNLSNNEEVASTEFTGWLFNFHPVGETDIGFLVNEWSGVNKFVSKIWKWEKNEENLLFDGLKEEGAINWSLRDKRRGNIIAKSVDYFQSPKQVTYIQVLSKGDNTPIYATTKKGGFINRYELSPNAKFLALSRNNGAIEVHDMDRLAKVWESEPSQLGAGVVRSLEFSPDGELLLAAGGGQNLGLWEAGTGRLVTSDLHHKAGLAMVNWNEQGNAFLTTSRAGEVRLYEIPNPSGADYLSKVAMTPKTTRAISEALSTRSIDEGRIVSFTNSETNTAPSLASLPKIHQYSDSDRKRQWHLSRATVAKGGNQWSAAKFHLDHASALAPLGALRIHNRFNSHLNLGQYESALADLALLEEVAEKGETTTVDYMPAIATRWKKEVWYYSGYSSCSDQISGFNQEYLNQQSLGLNNSKTWVELPEFSPIIGQYGINMNNITEDDIFVDAPENSVYYISKKFEINESGFHQIVFDSDDAMMVWINGEIVHTYFHNNGRGLQSPGRDLVTAWVQKGVNIVTIKIVNSIGPTGFSFVVGDQQDGIFTTQRNYALLALGRKNEIELRPNEQPANPGELFNQAQEFALFNPKKEVWEQIDQKLRSNPVFKSILEGSFIRPASYVIPKNLPTQDQLKDGFTVECFINTQQKQGIHHIVCNGGSWEESGFSLLTVGGVIRGELQNTETQEKILMDVPYPYDQKWHHVAMVYDAFKKQAIVYFDGKPATVPTAYKSPLIFNPKYLRIGENEMRRMGFNGGITDIRIWPKVLSAETIEKHALGEMSSNDGKPLINLPLRFANVKKASQSSETGGFIAENINWRQANMAHPMAKEEDWVYARFRNQGFGNWQQFTIAGILEYRRGNYPHAMELLFRAFNNGRYLPEVKIRTRWGNRVAQLFIAMAFQKGGRQADYERFRQAINVDLNKFEMRTWELPNEIDVLERIKLKTLQREMNALAEE
jgi:energy-coupling factor transporter ATP-binding protein EcfA2